MKKNSRSIMNRMSLQKPLKVDIDEFQGVNLSLSKNKVQDNQLTDCRNFYKKDGCLQVRPGLSNVCDKKTDDITGYFPGKEEKIDMLSISPSDAVTTMLCKEFSGKFIVTLGEILFFNGKDFKNITLPINKNKFSGGLIISEGKTYESETIIEGDSFKASSPSLILVTDGSFLRITAEVFKNDEGNLSSRFVTTVAGPTVPVISEECNPMGEGRVTGSHNILTGRCYQKFNTDGNALKYNLADRNLDSQNVEVKYTDENLTENQIVFSDNDTGILKDSVTVTLNRKMGVLTFNAPLINSKEFNLKNNLTVCYSTDNPLLCSVESCSVASWFNGGSKSKYGSGRLFISNSPKKPNRVFCSEPNNPLYFRDDAYFDVGPLNEKITALQNFDNSLLIFTEKSIFTLSYAEKLTGEEFVLKERTGTIGCPYKFSIVVFDDRLIFLSNDGVFELLPGTKLKKLSGDIDPLMNRLLNKSMLSLSSAKYKNYYLILLNDTVFALNCDNLNKENNNTEWYIFNFRTPFRMMMNVNDKTYFLGNGENAVAVFNEEEDKDSGHGFEAYFETRGFDFDIYDYYKKLIKLSVGIKALSDDEVGFSLKTFFDGNSEENCVSFKYNANSESMLDLKVSSTGFSKFSIRIEKSETKKAEFGITGFSAKALKTYPER